VNKRLLALTLGSTITALLFLFTSCKKINDATELGADLIPPIDNVTTFDTIVTVEAYNDIFTLGGAAADSLRQDTIRSHYSDEQFLGIINSDPLFGKTEAQMAFELRPLVFPFAFANKKDSIFLDSVVLVLDYVETYGDSAVSQTINVSEITSEFRADSLYFMRTNPVTLGGSLGPSRTIVPSGLDDSVKAYLDTTTHQLRIPLSAAFGNRLLSYDSISSGPNNAYSSDSAFKTKFKGFGLRSTSSGNAVMGFNLQGANTKLAIYYRYLHGVGTDLDTTVTYFSFKPYNTYFTQATASHNYIKRDYSTAELLAAQGGTTPDELVYIQNTPGTFATIKIPALTGLSNRVIHRAELIAEQSYHPTDTLFPAPSFLYVDAYSPSISKFRNIPYDVVYDYQSGSFNLNSFGVAPINAFDASGRVVKTWHFNLSRYVQHIVNGTEPVYNLRLFAPYYVSDQYFDPAPNAAPVVGPPTVSVNPRPVIGRVRLIGNAGPSDTNPHRLRLRIVYSKI
jgi:hypothetical protein